MKINKSKTKVVLRKNKRHRIKLRELAEIKECLYPRGKITWDRTSLKHIKCTISEAKTEFDSKQKLLCSSSINLEIRTILLKTSMVPRYVGMWKLEDWRISGKGLEAFEMSCYKRRLKIKWEGRITNEEVLEKIDK